MERCCKAWYQVAEHCRRCGKAMQQHESWRGLRASFAIKNVDIADANCLVMHLRGLVQIGRCCGGFGQSSDCVHGEVSCEKRSGATA